MFLTSYTSYSECANHLYEKTSNMLHQSLVPFLSLLLLSAPSTDALRRRCAFGDRCWPEVDEWKAFNTSVNGNLIQSVPSAAVCHQDHYNSGLCDVAKSEWTNSFWRTNQTGAYSAILWELGNDQCFINSTKETPCDQGLGELALHHGCLILIAQ